MNILLCVRLQKLDKQTWLVWSYTDLLLPQDDNSTRFDGVPSGQVVAGAELSPILVSVPLAIPCGPGNADVVPPSISHL